jgi:aromatic-amino-acid transaminase
VLASPELRAQWELELQAMRERIKLMRSALSENVSSKSGIDFSFITEQRGMFSYSGLTREQVVKLREDYSIYAVESGRICVAALNNSNISLVSEAIANVVD